MMNNVGEKINEIRKIKGLGIEDLAERAGLSIEQIEHIENDEILPSLSPLIKIARVLGVRLGTFLDDEDRIGPVVSRKEDHTKSISFSNDNTSARKEMEFFSLAGNKSGRHMEPFLINLSASESKEFISSSHEGEEFLYVLSGSVSVSYGKESFVLYQGDSIYYDSIVKHHVSSENNEQAILLAVVYAPF
ncbi:helix-turn-helix domain-containing protein [Saccharicrinis sp. FJH54]|uniref:helix-turn-helix domain-containing protein n=1 Tax=Saccharicrinis sp. FJH54 TaxID=3344665 RepID=UPI0035D3D8B0